MEENKQPLASDRIDAVLDFWLPKYYDGRSAPPQELFKLWFGFTPELD